MRNCGPAFDAVGYPKPTRVCYSAVAAMVYLRELIERTHVGDQIPLAGVSARARVGRFLQELEPLVGVKLDESDLIPVAFAEKIEAGWSNYREQQRVWPALVESLAPALQPGLVA